MSAAIVVAAPAAIAAVASSVVVHAVVNVTVSLASSLVSFVARKTATLLWHGTKVIAQEIFPAVASDANQRRESN